MQIVTTNQTIITKQGFSPLTRSLDIISKVGGRLVYAGVLLFSVLLSSMEAFAQPASVTWGLSSAPFVTSSSGNVVGTNEILSGGSSPVMSIFDYNSNGQRLWVGNTGWVAASPPQEDPLRYIQFDAAATSGNSLTVTSVSFNYGDFQTSTDFNILKANVYYSTDNWNTRTSLAAGLSYLNTSMSSFSQSMGVTLAAGTVFSLRIYPYPVLNGLAMTPTFAIHNTVVINGTTTSTLGSICGRKFNDVNGNGMQDPGEAGIPNWSINLSYNLATGPVTLTAMTDSSGNYCFNSLQPGGTYTVSETNQAGWQQTFPSNPGTHTVLLGSGQQADSLDFGNMRLPALGSICGMKFNDLDGDGVQDANEPGLPGWEITLSYNLATGPVTLTTTTDSSGNYCFNNLQGGGSYTVGETNQTGWQQTFPSSPGTHTVTLTAGQNLTGMNFGNTTMVPGKAETCVTWDLSSTNLVTSVTGTIVGQPESIGVGSSSPFMSVFLPYSGGQRLWVGTTGWVAGTIDLQRYIEFNASPSSGNSLTVTSVSFQYGDNPLSVDFNILKSQVFYSVDGWVNSIPLGTTLSYLNTSVQTFSQTIGGGVVVPAGQVFSLRIFPYSTTGSIAGTPSFAIHSNVVICGTTTPADSTTGSICGTKFNDLDGDGVQDANEPGLAGWEITLSYNLATGPVTLTTTTDSSGNYCFNNLQGGGSYTVGETNQTGWQQTFPSSPGTHTIVLTAGQNVTGVNFGNSRKIPGETGACVTWGLSSSNLVTSVTGNIVGQPQSIGAGSSSPSMVLYLPYSGGQRLWVGTTGWVAGTIDLQRYIEFNAAPASGHSLTVTSISFQYGDEPFSMDFNILKSQVFYSIDGWVNSVALGSTLSYLNTSVQTFSQILTGGVVVPAGQVFSLRIFPYSTTGSIAITPSFATHSNVVICGTTASVVSVEEDERDIVLPHEFILGQNYPNPFNPSTSIRYSLAKAGMVVLKVYSMLGLEVSTLVNGHQEAGSYNVTFPATGASTSALPSGVYFYRLEAGSFISVKKLLLLK